MNSKRAAPDQKQIQYDRQLRLWGDHGQRALENARVCLIGANALGTEILKSLVLPGLGSFTIIDHHRVSSADCGSNFFVHPSMIDQSRAQVSCELLKKLNPDVCGDFIDEPSIDNLLEQNTMDFGQYNVVILAYSNPKTCSRLASILWSQKIPLICVRTFGFIGTLRIQVAEHYVIEAHPDDTIPDVRLDRPLTKFSEYCDSIDLKSLTREEHLHLPSLVILYKTLQHWQKDNERTDLPRTRQDKEQMKMILDQYSEHHELIYQDPSKNYENFQEAKRHIPSRLVETSIPTTIQELFEDRCCLELNEQTNIFWFIIHAIKLFTQNEGKGLLPVRGELPDMITDTKSYVRLVQIYKEQAKQDCEYVQSHLFDLLTKYNETLAEKLNLDDLVQTYCKNAYFLQVLRTKLIDNEDILINTDQNDIVWFLGLHICDLFLEQYGRYPGDSSPLNNDIDVDQQQMEIDLADVKQISRKFFLDHPAISEKQQTILYDQILEELCRYAGAEVHSIAAYLGGCCAQEAIKLITHQYVPIDNTLLYNGISQTTSTFKL